MPNLDGIGVLKALHEQARRPSVIIVSMTDEESELGVSALELGAFDVVTKPTALANDRLYDLGKELRAKVLAAAHRAGPPPTRIVKSARLEPTPAASNTTLLLIGASTGGPQAIALLLRALPADFPVPIAVVNHMPAGYTDPFARRVDAESRIEVMEARDGLALMPGRAIIARAGLHLAFRATPEGWACALDTPRGDTPHRPAVDVMFQSGAAIAGAGALGVVLTGMGNDGLVGSHAIRDAGGRVLTEAESSCVVYGMPRCVAEAGLSNAVATIESMADLVLQYL
jgi:two-component system chemotaxis response regulator CheB